MAKRLRVSFMACAIVAGTLIGSVSTSTYAASITDQLLKAAYSGHVSVVELLLQRCASIDLANHRGTTPLIYAAANGHVTVVELLLQRGASIDLASYAGNTALICAAANGRVSVVELLLQRGAFIDSVSKNGTTPLIWAAGNGHVSVIELLLQRGAALHARNNQNLTPWDRACSNNSQIRKQCIRLLLCYHGNAQATQPIPTNLFSPQEALLQRITQRKDGDQSDKDIETMIQELQRADPQTYKTQLPLALTYALEQPGLVALLLRHTSPHAILREYTSQRITPITILQRILRYNQLTQEERVAYEASLRLLAQAAAVHMRLIVRLLTKGTLLPDELCEHIFILMHPEYTPAFRTLILQNQEHVEVIRAQQQPRVRRCSIQ